jgi:small-conductance mechanosensitive channel
MISGVLGTVWMGNSVRAYLVSAVMMAALSLAVLVFKIVFVRRLKVKARKTATTADDFLAQMLDRKVLPLLFLAALYLSVQGLVFPARAERWIRIAGVVLATVLVVRLVLSVIVYVLEAYQVKREGDPARAGAFKGILTVIKIIVWSVAAVILLDNLGIKISALVAGLGIGGVAIALAAQAVLADLFSYFCIFFDRPFEIGDFIIVGDFMGAVEKIGIKTTRIRSLGGELLVFSNTDLTNSRVRNYKKMEKRRVVFKIGVTYSTPLERLRELPQVFTAIIREIPDTQFDRAHFFSYGDFSLIYEVVYYVLDSDYNKYMDIQQKINFRIHEEFDRRGVEIAFPTQTLHVNMAPKQA